MRAVTTTTASTSRAVDGGRGRRVSGRGSARGGGGGGGGRARRARGTGSRERTSWSGGVRWGVGRDGRDAETRVWASADAGAGVRARRARARGKLFAKHLRKMISPLDGLRGRLIPMSLMFFSWRSRTQSWTR